MTNKRIRLLLLLLIPSMMGTYIAGMTFSYGTSNVNAGRLLLCLTVVLLGVGVLLLAVLYDRRAEERESRNGRR